MEHLSLGRGPTARERHGYRLDDRLRPRVALRLELRFAARFLVRLEAFFAPWIVSSCEGRHSCWAQRINPGKTKTETD